VGATFSELIAAMGINPHDRKRCMSLLVAPSCLSEQGGVGPLRRGNSDVHLFCYCERVIDLYSQTSNGALDFRVTQ